MRSPSWVAAIMVLAACSSSPSGDGSGAPPPPVAWTAGHYTLEARITTVEGGVEELTGDLTIRGDGSMTLLSSFGSCRTPTATELRRDEERRRRTFVCGDATYIVEPTSDRVRGQVRARVTETYRERVACAPGRAPPCFAMRTRRVTRSADLRVFVLD
jgi:hypothetical protein